MFSVLCTCPVDSLSNRQNYGLVNSFLPCVKRWHQYLSVTAVSIYCKYCNSIGNWYRLFHISVRHISAEGHFGQNFSVTEHFGHRSFRSGNISVTELFGHRTFRSRIFSVREHFGHGTFRSENISVTEHFGHRTFRSRYISVREHFGHRTFRSGYISVRDFFGQRTIQYTFALFFIIILSHLLGSNKNVKNWQNALKPI